jgi:GH24 family phage-related lysozyme (muramidase)
MKASALLPPLAGPKKSAVALAPKRAQGARAVEVTDEKYNERMREALAERATRQVQPKATVSNGYGDLVAAARAGDVKRPPLRLQRKGACPRCAGNDKGTPPCPTCGDAERLNEEEGMRRRGKVERPIQRQEAEGSTSGALPKEVEEIARSSAGQPLDPATASFFESRFGHDFSAVRVHSGQDADAAARSVNALAFTVGDAIVFRQRHYDPSSDAGRRLLAHELAHVVQQKGGRAVPEGVSRADDPAEREADQIAEAIVHGSEAVAVDSAVEIRRGISRQPAPDPEGTPEPAAPQASPQSGEPQEGKPEEAPVYDKDIMDIAPKELTERATSTYRTYEAAEGARAEAIDAAIDAAKGTTLLLEAYTPEEKMPEATRKARVSQIKAAQAKLEGIAPGWAPPLPLIPLAAAVKQARLDVATLVALPRLPEVTRAFNAATAAGRDFWMKAQAHAAADDALTQWLKKSGAWDPATGRKRPCVVPEAAIPQKLALSKERLDQIKKQECFAPLPYVAGEGDCTIGYGHVVKKQCKPAFVKPGEPKMGSIGKCGTHQLCDCSMVMTEAQAHDQLMTDLDVAARDVQKNVRLNLTPDQLRAFVDLQLAVGHIPKEFLIAAYDKLCTDDEAMRQLYQSTATKTPGRPDIDHAPRRRERVWDPASK